MSPAASHGHSVAELELADRARDGDREAMVELYQRYRQPLFRHAWRMLRNDTAAQDVVQEAFARAIAAIPRTRAQLRFKAWIFRIATNLCLRQLSRGGRLVLEEDSEDRPPTAGSAIFDPERDRRRAEIAGFVTAALERMPPRYRQILLLREIEELSYDELAQVLELDISRVKVTLHRARARFAAIFITEQLLADHGGHLKLACDDLRQLLQPPSPKTQLLRSQLERHLEGCPRCRKQERRPTAELFSLLPPVPALSLPEPPPLGAAASASGLAAGSGTGVAAWAGLIAVGLVVTGLAIVTPPTRRIDRARQPVPPSAIRSRAAPSTGHPRPPAMQAALGTITPSATSDPVERRPPPRGPGTGRAEARPAARRKGGGAVDKPAEVKTGLRVKLRFTRGTVTLLRGGQTFTLTEPRQIHVGDVIQTHPGASMGLMLPGSQWMVVQGRTRIDAVPAHGATVERVRVTLLAGQLRAKATPQGRGIEVAVLDSRCVGERGEFRVRRTGSDVQVESLDGYLFVRGPHAARQMTPSTRLVLGRRPGFSHGLLPPATRLRPVASRSSRPPLLSWDPVPGASGYQVQIASDTDFMQILQTHLLIQRRVRPKTLAAGKYFWQVVATDGRNLGQPSKIYSFVID